MSGQQATDPTKGGTVTDPTQSVIDKGKGKAADTPQDVSMGEDEDDSSDEETGAEEDEPEQGEDEDDMQEIDLENIVGDRLRGKTIDYHKVDPAEFPEDDEDDDDDDFEDPDADHDAMEE
ncbi:MAG: hypothetical protein Q9201_004386 [Fulgogasparrea decipioides]